SRSHCGIVAVSSNLPKIPGNDFPDSDLLLYRDCDVLVAFQTATVSGLSAEHVGPWHLERRSRRNLSTSGSRRQTARGLESDKRRSSINGPIDSEPATATAATAGRRLRQPIVCDVGADRPTSW